MFGLRTYSFLIEYFILFGNSHTCEQLIIILCIPTPLPTLPRHPQRIPLSFTFSDSVRRGALEVWLPQQGWPESCILFSPPTGTIFSQPHRGWGPGVTEACMDGWIFLPFCQHSSEETWATFHPLCPHLFQVPSSTLCQSN